MRPWRSPSPWTCSAGILPRPPAGTSRGSPGKSCWLTKFMQWNPFIPCRIPGSKCIRYGRCCWSGLWSPAPAGSGPASSWPSGDPWESADLLLVMINGNTVLWLVENISLCKSGLRFWIHYKHHAIKTQRKGRNTASRGFGAFSSVVIGREQHHDINQSEHSICSDPDQWDSAPLGWWLPPSDLSRSSWRQSWWRLAPSQSVPRDSRTSCKVKIK